MSAPEFFIADDINGDLWVWAKNGDQPRPMLDLFGLHAVLDGPALLELIRAVVEGERVDEWGVRHSDGTEVSCGWMPGISESFARRALEPARPDRIHHPNPHGEAVAVLRRTRTAVVITGAWEES